MEQHANPWADNGRLCGKFLADLPTFYLRWAAEQDATLSRFGLPSSRSWRGVRPKSWRLYSRRTLRGSG